MTLQVIPHSFKALYMDKQIISKESEHGAQKTSYQGTDDYKNNSVKMIGLRFLRMKTIIILQGFKLQLLVS